MEIIEATAATVDDPQGRLSSVFIYCLFRGGNFKDERDDEESVHD